MCWSYLSVWWLGEPYIFNPVLNNNFRLSGSIIEECSFMNQFRIHFLSLKTAMQANSISLMALELKLFLKLTQA
ncbi:hypothetical protein BpHYR1_032052 [Brachionus plicatilis]|uniref:Uncharacterized protein n=1 Tax=Brachionus plicatilis TaxID=10195 RepID=A0A3M7P8K4_BRAPC|nr:hypothetical protein BpHYR1_032052 [Brachionus plicatilis]